MTTTNQRAVELAPCPFCGAQPVIGPWAAASEVWPNATAVECSSGLDDCPVNPSADGYDREAAIAAWNRRTPGWRPISEEQVEVAAIRMWNAMGPGPEWAHQTERTRNQYRTMARAALSTLPPPPGEG